MRGLKRFLGITAFSFLGLFLVSEASLPQAAFAKTAKEIEVGVEGALERFKDEVVGANKLLKKSKGALIFPSVIKAGIGIGGEYGQGALQINGKTVDYYSTAGASIGFQLGVQAKTVIVLFMTADSLKHFQNSEGWKAGVDGSVAVIELDAGGAVDTETAEEPIMGFIFGRKGLMYNLTLEGSKFTKIKK